MKKIFIQAQLQLISQHQRISFDAKEENKYQIFQNKSGVGVHFILKTSTGKYH